MPNIGDRFKVGTTAPATGRYRHSACGDTAIFNRGNTLAPCSRMTCANRGADWILIQLLT